MPRKKSSSTMHQDNDKDWQHTWITGSCVWTSGSRLREATRPVMAGQLWQNKHADCWKIPHEWFIHGPCFPSQPERSLVYQELKWKRIWTTLEGSGRGEPRQKGMFPEYLWGCWRFCIFMANSTLKTFTDTRRPWSYRNKALAPERQQQNYTIHKMSKYHAIINHV